MEDMRYGSQMHVIKELTSEELQKQVHEYLKKGGTIKEVSAIKSVEDFKRDQENFKRRRGKV